MWFGIVALVERDIEGLMGGVTTLSEDGLTQLFPAYRIPSREPLLVSGTARLARRPLLEEHGPSRPLPLLPLEGKIFFHSFFLVPMLVINVIFRPFSTMRRLRDLAES